jgi:hypothetical protein
MSWWSSWLRCDEDVESLPHHRSDSESEFSDDSMPAVSDMLPLDGPEDEDDDVNSLDYYLGLAHT